MVEHNDESVIEALLNGDNHLYQKFYLRERPSFIKWCGNEYGLVDIEAVDFYQDAQMYLYENVKNGKLSQLSSSLKTYLYSIAKNLLRVKFKKMVVMKNHEEKLCEHLVFLQRREDLTLEKERQVGLMAKVLKEMKEPCKSLILLFYYEELSFKKIANRMGYKNDVVAKNQKKRCLAAMRSAVTDGE